MSNHQQRGGKPQDRQSSPTVRWSWERELNRLPERERRAALEQAESGPYGPCDGPDICLRPHCVAIRKRWGAWKDGGPFWPCNLSRWVPSAEKAHAADLAGYLSGKDTHKPEGRCAPGELYDPAAKWEPQFSGIAEYAIFKMYKSGSVPDDVSTQVLGYTDDELLDFIRLRHRVGLDDWR